MGLSITAFNFAAMYHSMAKSPVWRAEFLPLLANIASLPRNNLQPAHSAAGSQSSQPPLELVSGGDLSVVSNENRHMLCVAFVDVIGFSAQMHKDEEGTFHKWSVLRDEVVLAHLEKFGGTLIKSTGDGILGTFPDALSGARWGRGCVETLFVFPFLRCAA